MKSAILTMSPITNDVAAEETSMTSGKVPVSQWHILNDDADSDFLSWI